MSRIAQQLNQAWLRRGPLAIALWPLSMVMASLVHARRWGYRRAWLTSVRLPVPVIVVGNRVVGGAGKTPTTIALLTHLRSLGWQPGVLSRGYKARRQDSSPILIDALSVPRVDASQTGDEPLLIWRRTGVPVMVGLDRGASGQALLAAHPEINVLICDDGLQHLRLQRDIEIIVFDERGEGNGWLLPAGPLREPIGVAPPKGLCAPPIVIYNAPRATTRLSGHLASKELAPLRALDDWWRGASLDHGGNDAHLAPHGQSVWAVAGIAHPQRFFDALTQAGLNFRGIALDDHADFVELPWPVQATDVIVTEKDAVKLLPARISAERPGCRVWVAALDFRPAPTFWVAVDAALARLNAPTLNA